MWVGGYVVSWKICRVVLVLVGVVPRQSSVTGGLPLNALDWESLKDDDLSENFLRITGSRPYVCIQPHHNHLVLQIYMTNIWCKYLSQIFLVLVLTVIGLVSSIPLRGHIHPEVSRLNNNAEEKDQIPIAKKNLFTVCIKAKDTNKWQTLCSKKLPTADNLPFSLSWTNSRNLWPARRGGDCEEQSRDRRYAECGHGGCEHHTLA